MDAAIIGRADAVQGEDKIRTVDIPAAYFKQEIIAVALLTNGRHRPEVLALQKYLSGPEAVNVFREYGFLPLTP